MRRRKCEIEGGGVEMKDTCAGTDVDTRECRNAELCPAEAKDQSVCLKTKTAPPSNSKVNLKQAKQGVT